MTDDTQDFVAKASEHIGHMIVFARGVEKVMAAKTHLSCVFDLTRELLALEPTLVPELNGAMAAALRLNAHLDAVAEYLNAKLDVSSEKNLG